MASPPLLLLAVLTGCGSVDYNAVDIELYVHGGIPDDAETIDMCVAGAGILEEGAGNGRVLFAGLPADVATTVSIDIRDADGAVLGGAGPAVFDSGTRLVEVDEDSRAEPCAADGQPVSSDAASWVLGVRFSEEPW